MLKTGLFVICFFVCSTSLGQTGNMLLPRFNYWELSLELLHSDNLVDQLDVSPNQLTSLRAMRARREWDKLLKEEIEKLQMNRTVGGGSEDTQAWNQLDGTVKEELALIFEPSQLSGLRRAVVRQHFPFGFSPFEENEVRRQLRLSKSDSVALDSAVKKVQKNHIEKSAAIVRASRLKIVSALPVASRERFARYFGIDFLTGRPAAAIDEKDKGVYPLKYRHISLIGEYALPHSSKMALTPKQVAAIEQIYAKYTDNLDFNRPVEHLNKVSEEAKQELESILSEADFLSIAPIIARKEFEIDFRRVFGRTKAIGLPAEVKFCDFLQMTADEEKSILEFVDAEWQNMLSNSSTAEKEVFNKLLEMIPKDKRLELSAFFEDVW